MINMFSPLAFRRGKPMSNRFMLAPLTNTQSHDDGVLSDDEFTWLTMRAKGGFGAVMTCAAHVSATGQGFPGQLGIFDDKHLPGLSRLAAAIGETGALSLVQLQHAGNRAPAELIGEAPMCPSDDGRGAREMTADDVAGTIEDFIAAAVRAEAAGFDGVELHGAHGYLICEFLSPELNRRTDSYGGSPENRARYLYEILAGVRERCSDNFIVGIRLSPERFGLELGEIVKLSESLLVDDRVDFLDVSLWDCFKEPEDEAFKGRLLADYFTELERGDTKLGFAGKLNQPSDIDRVMAMGIDFALLGRAAIIHHNYPQLYAEDFVAETPPVSPRHLAAEGVSAQFIKYLGNFPGFVSEPV
ncbi:MAG: NADH:flavin oxidoreductase [Acidimicrobiales bacterium]